MKTIINEIIKQLRDIQNGKIWIGENFNKKLINLTSETAFTRPISTLHSVAEIISHLTVWRQESILKIKTRKGSITDDLEDNWFGIEHLQKDGWHKILANYNQSSEELIDLLEAKDDSFLQEIYFDTDYKGNYPYSFLINGMVHHDLYHLGQIGIILKLINEKYNV